MTDTDHTPPASAAVRSDEIAAISATFADGYARIREVIDTDGACPAADKALYVAAAAAARGHAELTIAELGRARERGLPVADAEGAALAVLISRGEGAYARFRSALAPLVADDDRPVSDPEPAFEVDREVALDHFRSYFGEVPSYIELMADTAPRALEGYTLMRRWSLAENPLAPKRVELLFCAINAADFGARFVAIHAAGARRAGATPTEIVEAALCAIPVSGLATWIPAADAIQEGLS